MNILLIHTEKQSMSALKKLIGAAEQLSKTIDLIYIGENDLTQLQGVQQVFHYSKATLNSPSISHIIQAHDQNYQTIMVHSDTTAKDFIPYYCGQIRSPMLSDISKIIDKNHFERAIYAGAIREQIKYNGDRLIMSIRGIYFEATASKATAKIKQCTTKQSIQYPELIKTQTTTDEIDLSTAEIVVSGGRGLGSKENFAKLFELAKQFNAAVGASRAAVDAGYIDNSHQVGQTGKIIAPRVYISLGISGAVQHLSGMKDAQIIIAIDKNPEAPIFSVADYGYSGDLFNALEKLKGKNIIPH
jgi:electron transfer flavoprotein alpha subunit